MQQKERQMYEDELGKFKPGTETSEDQFAQVVQSFFAVNPDKGELALLAYVELHSKLDYQKFEDWRTNGKGKNLYRRS